MKSFPTNTTEEQCARVRFMSKLRKFTKSRGTSHNTTNSWSWQWRNIVNLIISANFQNFQIRNMKTTEKLIIISNEVFYFIYQISTQIDRSHLHDPNLITLVVYHIFCVNNSSFNLFLITFIMLLIFCLFKSFD